MTNGTHQGVERNERPILRRVAFVLACLATLLALFYTEEKGRGKRTWENCRRELEAKGEILDWAAYIPPSVPDEQNIFKAPKIREWFVKESFGNPNQVTKGTNTRPFSGVPGMPKGDTNPVLVDRKSVV